MKKSSLLIALLVMSLNTSAYAEDRATSAEAEAMVKKAVAYIKENGPEKGYPAVNDKAGPFIYRDLYVVVYDMKGNCLAHGANAKLIGQDLSDAQDVDGKLYIKERIQLAQSKPNFWQDYKFVNPVTKKIEPKQMYCERLDNTAICGGVYKS